MDQIPRSFLLGAFRPQYRMPGVENRSKALWYALASAFAFAVMGLFVAAGLDDNAG